MNISIWFCVVRVIWNIDLIITPCLFKIFSIFIFILEMDKNPRCIGWHQPIGGCSATFVGRVFAYFLPTTLCLSTFWVYLCVASYFVILAS